MLEGACEAGDLWEIKPGGLAVLRCEIALEKKVVHFEGSVDDPFADALDVQSFDAQVFELGLERVETSCAHGAPDAYCEVRLRHPPGKSQGLIQVVGKCEHRLVPLHLLAVFSLLPVRESVHAARKFEYSYLVLGEIKSNTIRSKSQERGYHRLGAGGGEHRQPELRWPVGCRSRPIPCVDLPRERWGKSIAMSRLAL